jgi:hypothetical protein
MVNTALSLGGLVGVGLSGAFMYWQVGRYAAPQVPRTLFEERKEFIAYTVGLFAGIPLALPLLFYIDALGFGAILGAAIDLALLVAGTELAQWLLLRTVYFGQGESGAFYALGFRAGIGGLLCLAVVAQYLSGPALSALGIGVVLVQSLALVVVQVAASLLAVRGPPRLGRIGGSPFAGGLFALFGLFLLGLGSLIGSDPTSHAAGSLGGAAIAGLGGAWVFFRLREPVLGGLAPPRNPDEEAEEGRQSPYGRIAP